MQDDGAIAVYRFFPDHVMAPGVSGTFQMNLTTFEAHIVEPADAEARGLVSTDEHCVSALVHKIRRTASTSEGLPKQVFYVA